MYFYVCVPDIVSYQENNNLLCYEFCPGFADLWLTNLCLVIMEQAGGKKKLITEKV